MGPNKKSRFCTVITNPFSREHYKLGTVYAIGVHGGNMGLTREALRLFLAVTALLLTVLLTNPLQESLDTKPTQNGQQITVTKSPYRSSASAKKAPRGQKLAAFKVGKKT